MSAAVYRFELRELFRLALPLAAAQAGTQLMGLVDMAVLGRVGARELAAAGLGNAVYFAVSIIGMGIIYGVDPLISQAIGAGDVVRAHRTLWQGIWLALIVSAVLSIPLLFAPLLLPMIHIEPELIAPATSFLVVRTIGLAPHLLFLVYRAYLQARGVTRPMVIAMVVANVFNLLLDILFVFGGTVLPEWSGPLRQIPAMSVAGAALSTVLCTFLELAVVAVAARRMRPDDGASMRRWRGAEVAQAFRVGLPLGLQLGAEVGVFALVGLMAGRLGTLHLAAHQTVISIASFTYTVSLGIAAAASVRVGIGVGAQDITATRAAGRAALVAGASVMAVPAMLFLFVPRPILRLLTDSETVIAASIPLLVVAAVFQLSDGVQAVGAGVLRGAGDTKFSMIANLLGHWVIGLPIALLLGFGHRMGIVGLWWGLCAGLTVVAVLLFARFERISRKTIVPLATVGAQH